MAELICNSRLFWMKTIYLSKSDVKPLSLLPDGICDSGIYVLTDITRCLPSDDGAHRILCVENDDATCRPLLGARPSEVPSHPYRAAATFPGAGHSQTPICPAFGWVVTARLDGRVPVWLPRGRPDILHDDNSYWWINCIITQLYVLDLWNWFE